MKRLWCPLLLLSIAALVISMALLWRDNVENDDRSTLVSWASAIFLCATD